MADPVQGDLVDVADALGRAATDPARWEDVARAVAALLPGTRVHLVGWDARMEGSVPVATAGYDAAHLASFAAYYSGINVHAPAFMRMREGQAAFAAEMAPDALLVRSEFYNDWLRPQDDIRGGAGVILANDRERRFMFGIHVVRRALASTEAPAMAAIRRLAPLMRQALDVNRLLLGHRLDAVALRGGAEPREAAVLLLAQDGTVLHANARAEAMLASGAAIGVDRLGRLRLHEAGADERLGAAIRAEAAGGRARSVRLGGGDGPLEARLMPVPPDVLDPLQLAILKPAQIPALLLVLGPHRRPEAEADHVARSLGLTRAEAQVALGLADGLTLGEVAARRGVSVETVRSQVKAALAKLGERRQGALAARAERARRRAP